MPRDPDELSVRLRASLLRGLGTEGSALLLLVDGQRCPDACHHVLSLGVEEILAVEHVVAGRGVPGEGNARTGVHADVAEDHGLHVDSRAPRGGDVVQLPVGDGAVVVP